jgi:predicted nucleic acid-binding protein
VNLSVRHSALDGSGESIDKNRSTPSFANTGKLVADTQHAALAIAAGATWVTRDADFKRFEPAGSARNIGWSKFFSMIE